MEVWGEGEFASIGHGLDGVSDEVVQYPSDLYGVQSERCVFVADFSCDLDVGGG